MFGKFALFVVVAFCAAQGYSASVHPETYTIIDDIKEVIHKIQTAVSDLVNKIPGLVSNLKDNIKKIIDDVVAKVSDISNVIQKKIEEILAQANVDINNAKQCIEAEKGDVEQMIKDTTDAIAKCKTEAESATENLETQFDKLKEDAKNLVSEILSGMDQCIKENGLNPIALLKCLTGHLSDVKTKADILIHQIATTIGAAGSTTADITVKLGKCTANVASGLIASQKQIIDNFQKCVDALNP